MYEIYKYKYSVLLQRKVYTRGGDAVATTSARSSCQQHGGGGFVFFVYAAGLRTSCSERVFRMCVLMRTCVLLVYEITTTRTKDTRRRGAAVVVEKCI